MKLSQRRIKIKSTFIPSDPTNIQLHDNLPFKPFHMKFSRLKHDVAVHHSYTQEHTQCASGISQEMYSKRILTEAQTNDIYESDFEEQPETSGFNQAVQEQNSNGQESSEFSSYSVDTKAQSNDPYEFYSIAYLNKRNQKLIQIIQYLRSGIVKYQQGITKLHEQEHQLKQLKLGRKKAFDYSYELELDRYKQFSSKASKSKKVELKQVSGQLKKLRYKIVKEAQLKARPTTFQIQFSSVDINKQSRMLSCERQELLAKKRQFYRQQQRLKVLDQKNNHYRKLLDIYQSILSRGNLENLQTRKEYLKNQITTKMAMVQLGQIELNLDIANINNQIGIIEARLFNIKIEQTRINKLAQNKNSMKKVSFFLGNQQSTKKIQDLPIQTIASTAPKRSARKTSKISIANIFPQKSPRVISKFWYNYRKGRNSNIFTQPQQ